MATTKQMETAVRHQPTAPKTPIGFHQFGERLAVASSPIEAVSRQQDVTKQPSLTNEAGVNRPPTSQDRKRAAAGGSNAGLILSPASYSSRETRVVRKKWKRGLHEGQSSSSLWGHHGCIPYTNPPNSSKTTDLEADDHADVKLKRALSSQSVFLSEKFPIPPVSMPLLDRSHTSELTIRAMEAAPLPHQLVLPTVQSSRHPDLNVISPHTVTKLLQGEFKTQLEGFKLLDCRFPFEFQGGSLVGARPLCDPDTMEGQLFGPLAMENSTHTALIFFCEFSANRAPKMLRHVRNLDRKLHADRYPELFYPELYLIDGGYKNCFETLQHEICVASALYIPMDDERFVEDCRLEFAAWRRRWKPHKAASYSRPKQQKLRRFPGQRSNMEPNAEQ
ncbi:hypothetical protein BBJ28_00020878 [Nothophytophthora sp. Chile5]|nr:hypothetical protein BBJ28_00020878 [Nothophytophthora sp. Chile5]